MASTKIAPGSVAYDRTVTYGAANRLAVIVCLAILVSSCQGVRTPAAHVSPSPSAQPTPSAPTISPWTQFADPSGNLSLTYPASWKVPPRPAVPVTAGYYPVYRWALASGPTVDIPGFEAVRIDAFPVIGQLAAHCPNTPVNSVVAGVAACTGPPYFHSVNSGQDTMVTGSVYLQKNGWFYECDWSYTVLGQISVEYPAMQATIGRILNSLNNRP